MKWFNLVEKYTQPKRPILKAMNPRFGTSIIPLNEGDEMIFFNYLQDKVHSLFFDGSDQDFFDMIKELEKRQGVIVHRMNLIEGQQDRLMHLHLGNTLGGQEIRRVIRMPAT